VVFHQQQEIRDLRLRVKEVTERLESLRADERQRPADEERPPHY